MTTKTVLVLAMRVVPASSIISLRKLRPQPPPQRRVSRLKMLKVRRLQPSPSALLPSKSSSLMSGRVSTRQTKKLKKPTSFSPSTKSSTMLRKSFSVIHSSSKYRATYTKRIATRTLASSPALGCSAQRMAQSFLLETRRATSAFSTSRLRGR